MTSSAATPRAGAFRRSGVRTSAAAAVLAFFGTAAMAPFSVANALPGDERAAVFDAAGAQEFTSAFAPEQALFLDRSAVVETGDAAGGSGGSGGSTPPGRCTRCSSSSSAASSTGAATASPTTASKCCPAAACRSPAATSTPAAM
ncbi:hypothetical protein [Leucobacter soli]|uniref:hypothetical protein n=1 Tax=Leucobacter soli TaxID=2812850 RepID=UPI00361D6F0D